MPTPYDDTDPFDDPAQVPNAGPGIMQEWGQALQDPNVRGALLSAGLQLMQPQPFGQTFAGGVGQAIGAAGESVTAREKMDLAQTESESRASERESRAVGREQSANTAAERLRMQQRDTESKIEKRKSDITTAGMRAQLLEQQVEKLKVQVELYPQSQEAKNNLAAAQAQAAEARSQLDNARAGVVESDAAARTSTAASRATDAETRRQRVLGGPDSEPGKNERSRTSSILRWQGLYTKEMEAIDKFNNDIINRNKPKQAKPTFRDWAAKQDPDLYRKLYPGSTDIIPDPKPIAPPTAPGAPDPLEGRTATMPDGTKRVRRNGQWEVP